MKFKEEYFYVIQFRSSDYDLRVTIKEGEKIIKALSENAKWLKIKDGLYNTSDILKVRKGMDKFAVEE